MQITEEAVLAAVRAGADDFYAVNGHIDAGSFGDNYAALSYAINKLTDKGLMVIHHESGRYRANSRLEAVS